MDTEQLIVNMHNDLSTKVDLGFKTLGDSFHKHELSDETRFGEIHGDLNELQNMRKTLRWFIGVVIVAMLGAAAEHVVNHRTPDVMPAVSAQSERR